MTPPESIESVIVYQNLEGEPIPTGPNSIRQKASPITGVMIDGKLLQAARITVDATNRGGGWEVHLQAEDMTLHHAEDFLGHLPGDAAGALTMTDDGTLGINAVFKTRHVTTHPTATMPNA